MTHCSSKYPFTRANGTRRNSHVNYLSVVFASAIEIETRLFAQRWWNL